MEWTTILRYEFVQEVQEAMDLLIRTLPQWNQVHPGAEVCHTWEEYVDGTIYIVNLCVNTLQGALYGG